MRLVDADRARHELAVGYVEIPLGDGEQPAVLADLGTHRLEPRVGLVVVLDGDRHLGADSVKTRLHCAKAGLFLRERRGLNWTCDGE